MIKILYYFLGSTSSGNLPIPIGNNNVDETNIDPHEVFYNLNQRDLDDTNIHHVLSENLFMPRNRVSLAKKCPHGLWMTPNLIST